MIYKDILITLLSAAIILALGYTIYGLIYHITLKTDMFGGIGLYLIFTASIVCNSIDRV